MKKEDENEKYLSFIDLSKYYWNERIYISQSETTFPPERQCGLKDLPYSSFSVGLGHVEWGETSFALMNVRVKMEEEGELKEVMIRPMEKGGDSTVFFDCLVEKERASVLLVEEIVEFERISFSFESLFSSLHLSLFECKGKNLSFSFCPRISTISEVTRFSFSLFLISSEVFEIISCSLSSFHLSSPFFSSFSPSSSLSFSNFLVSSSSSSSSLFLLDSSSLSFSNFSLFFFFFFFFLCPSLFLSLSF
jgi:hypothetical protein